MFALYFKICALVALSSTVWNNINDCDETFNYLEPLKFIVSNENHSAFQTWEYSPKFGLRSYLYLWTIGWPAYVLARFGMPGWLQFLSIRLLLSLLSATTSAFLASSSSSYLYPTDSFKRVTSGVIFCLIHSAAPGHFISASSAVPSAVVASMTSLMLSTWINGMYFYSVGAVAFSAIILWPFSACLGLPLAFVLLFSRMIVKFLLYSAFWGLSLITPMVLIDSFYYGKLICPAWNIITYNALSGIKGRSLSQLYGTETAAYYITNYFLNFNIVFVFACVFVVPVLLYLIFKMARSDTDPFYRRIFRLLCVALAPLFLWNLVFFLQSHKEERFLFPCYSCLSLLTTLLLCVLFLNCDGQSPINSLVSTTLAASFVIIFVGLSFSRILALSQGYSAPMYLVQHMPFSGVVKTLCIGRDWHHFPSHFLLPGENHAWRVHFLQSNFSGQLPGKFTEGVGIIKATRTPSSHFNDMNLPEKGTFFNIEKCAYILDRVSKPGQNEVQYSDDTDNWRVVLNRSILERTVEPLDSAESVITKAFNKFHRAFYLPYIFKTRNVWKEMHVLERISPA